MFPNNEYANLIQELHAEVPVVNPSLLACDFGNLQREIERLEQAGTKILHLDIMDGHFVPNLSIGVPVVEAIRKITKLPLDVHLMLDNPEKYLTAFRNAGADFLTVHIEVHPDPSEILQQIRQLGALPGLALNPPTPAETILPYLHLCDLVLTMSVMPGFGGQRFDENVLEKVRAFRAAVDEKHLQTLLSIDGGVNEDTIARCFRAGVHLLVAGTAVFKANDYRDQMARLRNLAREKVT